MENKKKMDIEDRIMPSNEAKPFCISLQAAHWHQCLHNYSFNSSSQELWWKASKQNRVSPKQLLRSYLSWSIYPGQMTKMGIHRNCHHVTVHITEFICFVAESHNFCGADKGAGWEERAGCHNSAGCSETALASVPRHWRQRSISFSMIIVNTFPALH